MMKSIFILAIIPVVLMLTVPNVFASERIDCNENPDHSLCNGERGITGTIFCDVQYQEEGSKSACYDRNDNPKEYCEKYRDIDKDFCEIIED
jgi:hypothetical protein